MALARWAVGFVVLILLLFLSLQNAEIVTVRFYNWFSWQAPLIFLLLVAFAIGVLAGLLAGFVRMTRLKRQLSKLRRDHARLAPAPTATPIDAP
jgi:putative membrane protein